MNTDFTVGPDLGPRLFAIRLLAAAALRALGFNVGVARSGVTKVTPYRKTLRSFVPAHRSLGEGGAIRVPLWFLPN